MEQINNPTGRPPIPSTSTNPQLTDAEQRKVFLSNRATLYRIENLRDGILWETFRDDFEGWTTDHFCDCDRIYLCKFRDLLRRRGVHVSIIPGLSPAGPLYDVLQETVRTKWTELEIEEYIKDGGRFISDTIGQFMIKNDIPFPPNIPQSKTSEPEFLSQQSSPHQATREPHQGGIPSPTSSAPREPTRNHPGNELPATEPAQGLNHNPRQLPLTQPLTQPMYQPTTQPTQQHPGLHEEPIGTPQVTEWYGRGTGNNFRTRNGDRDNIRNNQTDFQDHYDRNENFENPGQRNRSDDEPGYGNSLATLEKMYKEDYKYSGRNDNFDHKLGIFYEMCMKANVPTRYRNAAYSTMLKKAVLDHYHTNLRQHAQTAQLNDLTHVTRQYFESKEYQRGIIDQWTDITLESVMDKPENTGKSTTECLQILLKEIRHLKLGLLSEMKADVIFYSKLIHACRDFPACIYACCKPADEISSLINELETSITTYERRQKKITNTMFTDRRYHPQKYSYPHINKPLFVETTTKNLPEQHPKDPMTNVQ
jgi:hypothetical protein